MTSRWLGPLPDGWREGRLDQVASAWTSNVDKHSVEGQPRVRLCNYTDVYKNDTIVEGMDFMVATATPEQQVRFRLRRGDTVITKDSETADDIGVPAYIAFEADDLVCGYHLAIVRPGERIDPRFLYWVMTSRPTRSQWAVTAAGVTRVGIRTTDLTKLAVPVAPLEAQRAIAEFLDRETAKIDTLIAEQQRLIEMLRERRRSCVVSAISDIESTRAALRHVSRIVSGSGFPIEAQGQRGLELPYFKVRNLKSADSMGVLATAEDTVSRETAVGLRAAVLPAGSLVFAKVGAALMLGRVGAMPVDGCIDNNLAGIIPNTTLDPSFARYVMLTFDFMLFVQPGAVPSLNMDGLREFRVPVLPFDEQRRVAAYLDEQTAKIDALIAETERFIELSRERRAALITAAVTGQIDVRAGAF